MFGSSCSEVQISIVSSSSFQQSTTVSNMPFNVALRFVCLYYRTSSGVTGCNLIHSSDIYTSYSNLNLAIVSFKSLITRMSFTTFSTSVSSLQTCTYGTMLQVSTMDFFSCSHCYLASSLSLANFSSSFFIDFFSDSTFDFNSKISYSPSYNSIVIPWWNSCKI